MIDDWDLFDRIFEDMERRLRNLYKMLDEESSYVYGWSFRIGPDGKPEFREFGNLPRNKETVEYREPLIDIIDKGDSVEIVAEMPGVTKDEINLTTYEDSLVIETTGDRKYKRDIKLDFNLQKSKINAKYNNGILTVTIKKPKESRGKRIQIQ